jgi:3-hydroxyacyl-[acyl-carrier-protein] dehydratase
MMLSGEEILELIPQKAPFRFIDRIVELDDEHILGGYQFRKDESFYAGHFPGKPITPGVILLESMCQVGVVAHGIFLLSQELVEPEISDWITLFSEAQVEVLKPIYPGERVSIRGERILWRRKKLRSHVELFREDGGLAAVATISGIGVRR